MRGNNYHPCKSIFLQKKTKTKSNLVKLVKICADDEETTAEESSENDEETTEEESRDDRSVHYLFCSFNLFTGGWQNFYF